MNFNNQNQFQCPFMPCCHHHDREDRIEQHDHEFQGSTRIVTENEEVHNHRFAGVSGPARPYMNSHVHDIITRTDSFDHVHEIRDVSGPAIRVGNNRHVHFVRGTTTLEDGHTHTYQFATLIENPIGR